MKILFKAKRSDIFFLLPGKNYEQVYSKLQQLLSPEEGAFFSRIQYQVSSVAWMSALEGRATSYSVADESEKEEANSLIQEYQSSIKRKAEDDPELAGIIDQLLVIPSEDQIVIFNDMGNISVTLIQWGCQQNAKGSGINPIGKIVSLPVKDRTAVEIQAVYSDGLIAANTVLQFEYKGEARVFTADQDGRISLGLLKHHAVFSISEEQTGEWISVEVQEGQNLYEVALPFYLDYTVRVVNQLGEAMPGHEAHADYSNGQKNKVSNEEGEFVLEGVLLDQAPLTLKSVLRPDIVQEYSLNRENQHLIFEIKERIAGDIQIHVVDRSGECVASYPVTVLAGGAHQSCVSNDDGTVFLLDVELQNEISLTVTDGKNTDNVREYLAHRESDAFTFEIDPKMVRIKLIDHNKRPIPFAQLDITPRSEVISQNTDDEGNAQLAAEHFTDGTEVKAVIHLKKRKGRIKLKKKSFKYSSGQSEYIIRLKKFNWWWLLLLLIPLIIAILLIKLEKDIVVRTLSQNNVPVANAEVSLDYESYYLFNLGALFDVDCVSRDTVQYTDTMAYTSFVKLEHTVYSYLFKHFYQPEIWALTSCYASDTLRPVFHNLEKKDTLNIYLTPTLTALDFKVLDAEDREPLPDALVRYQYELNEAVVTEADSAYADGRVIVRNVPKCANLAIAHASLYGYFPDSIKYKYIPDIQGDIEKRTLELEPMLKKLEFFIVSCKTQQPIPDAIATVKLTAPDGSVTKGQATANTYGKVKWMYDDAHIISMVDIGATALPYYKPGRMDKAYRVDEFIKLPDALRTICLQPEDNSIVFRNIDEKASKGLSGVENKVTIARSGQDIDHSVMSSHPNGEFTVAGLQIGDVISIASYYDPCYGPNEFRTINKRDVIELLEGPQTDRNIPLEKKILTTAFTIVDRSTRDLISDADLYVFVDGRQVQPSNSSNGEFTVTGGYCANIKIVASKQDYKINDYTIDGDKTLEFYNNSPAQDREIPLNMSCGQATDASSGSGYKEYALGSETGFVSIDYDMKGHPDIMTVYCGKGTGGDILFQETITDTEFYSSSTFCFNAKKCGGYITVIIEPTPGISISNWTYSISCPEEGEDCQSLF